MHLEKASTHSSEAGLAGWISSNDVTLFTVVMVVVVAIFLQGNLIKGTKKNTELTDMNRKVQLQFKQAQADLAVTLEQLTATRDELAAKRDQLANTRTELESKKAALDDLRRRLELVNAQLTNTQRQLQSTKLDREQLELKRRQLDEQLAAAMRDVQAAREALDALSLEKKNLLTAADTLTKERDVLSKEKDTLVKTKQDLDTSLADLAAKLKQRLKDLDDLKRERDLLDQQALALADRVKRLEAQLGTSEKAMADLKKTSDSETASLRELLARALETTKTDIAKKDQELQLVSAKATEADTKAKDYLDRLQRAATYVRGVDEKKRLLELQIEALKVQLANALDQLQGVKDSLTNTRAQLTQRRNDAKTINKELVGITGQLKRVAIIFDSSGSMNESGRWDEVQKVTATWLQHLEFDECVLIVFSSSVSTFPADGSVIKVTGPDGEANRKRLLEHLKGVKPEGWTNTLAAIQTAYRYPGLDTIILFSDGAPTYDNSNKFNPEMASQIYALCKQHSGIPVNCIGLGNYFEQDLSTFLRNVAQLTGGTFMGR